MAVYNPPDQILFSPVSNYYHGKALRADTALREKQAQALQAEIDAAPAAAAAARRKQEIEENKERRAQEKHEREQQLPLRNLLAGSMPIQRFMSQF
jgi:hypothetical protein